MYANNFLDITPQTTSATQLSVHGNGAKVYALDRSLMDIALPTTVRDLEITVFGTANEIAVAVRSPTLMERVKISGPFGVLLQSALTARSLTVSANSFNGGTAIVVNGSTLTLDGAVISGADFGITATDGAELDLTNVLVSNTAEVGINLMGSASGSLNFVTVANTGADPSAIDAAGIFCSTSNVAIRSSVIWTPTSSRTSVSGCNFANESIAGPVGASGGMNIDPLFVDGANRNYHLSASSPAKDIAENGPPTDFEGDARPVDLFDLGADEVRP